MGYALIGLLLLVGLGLGTLLGFRALARAGPAKLNLLFRWVGGFALALMTAALLVSGRGAVVLGMAGIAAPYFLRRWLNGGPAAPPPGRDDDGSQRREPPPRATSNGMSREEAWATLGLTPGASEAEVRAAHKRLIKACHPDHGGSDALAARVNLAKDVLLGKA